MKKNLKKWSLNILELYCLTFRQKTKHALILDHSESLIYIKLNTYRYVIGICVYITFFKEIYGKFQKMQRN